MQRMIIHKNNKSNNSESGIALVAAMVITLIVMMLIASLTYLFQKAFQTNVINRKFSTVYEAANGGVEYTAGIMNSFLIGQTLPEDWSNVSTTTADTFTTIANCTSTDNEATIIANTADGNYRITTTLRCVGYRDIPGQGGVLRFPPQPALAGGTGTQATKYIFYSMISRATETNNPQSVGYTEAVYRVVQ
jgi:hypothetical protein